MNFVFVPGRHGRKKEFLLFIVASLVAFLIGTPLGSLLIKQYGINNWFALGATITVLVMVNYACRKFIIFKG